MATMFADTAFDWGSLNLNRLISNQTDFEFLDDSYYSYNGVTYEDVAYFEHYSGGYVGSYFGGSGVTFTSDYSRVTGGTVTGYLEEYWSGSSWVTGWGVQHFSIGAVTLAEAAYTSGVSDDYAVIAATLGGSDTIVLSPYGDFMRGYGGNDRLDGNAGDDRLYGDGGADTLNGGNGVDTMLGGAGSDTYIVGNSRDKVYETTTVGSGVDAGGNDTVRSTVSYTLGSFVEKLVLIGSAPVDGTGNLLANNLTGNGAANRLSGYAGADTLVGGGGNDSLLGGDGNDNLSGGSGLDVFRFNTAPNASTNRDRITDFDVADDKIQLENAVFSALTTTGSLASGRLRIGSAAADGNDFLVYDPGSGALSYDADGSGPTAAVRFAMLDTGLALAASDFFVT
jgi:Ca2+-binding RTX toxin-like protein